MKSGRGVKSRTSKGVGRTGDEGRLKHRNVIRTKFIEMKRKSIGGTQGDLQEESKGGPTREMTIGGGLESLVKHQPLIL